jgi:hypothetical protein
MFEEAHLYSGENSLEQDAATESAATKDAALEGVTTPEKIEIWRSAMKRLAAEAENHSVDCCAPGCCESGMREASYAERHKAFARVMQEALGSLLLRGGDDLSLLERWGLEK